ncbi:antibiotic biosynthesis monooxygenase family protein [Roseicyclus sp.]|uniref:antibiotic biosynthesis monooxygenase family protein n=1 Tax=Roseicyclus sp. TaxID=1914329 RepID=UPI003F6BEE6D
MHGLFFDVQPKPGHMPHYFEHVNRLKPILAAHEGLVFLDRYQPREDSGALLSHQLWADETAIARWRADSTHRASQAAGRRIHFDGYRIRVGEMVLHLTQDAAAPDRDLPDGRLLVVAYGDAHAGLDLPGARLYESVNHPGNCVALAGDRRRTDALDLAQRAMDQGACDLRIFAINRDYSLTDRAEAPTR